MTYALVQELQDTLLQRAHRPLVQWRSCGLTTTCRPLNSQVERPCHIYRRGPSYDAILAEIDAELQRQEDEVQDVLTELQAESDERIAGIMAGEDVRIVTDEPVPMSLLCDYDGPHYDCETCPDPDTNETPKHHTTAAGLAGHKRSNLHKRNNPVDEG